MTCTITPYTLAFPEVYTDSLYIFDMVMNVIFVIDMSINFLSAYYDAEFKIVDDYKVFSLHAFISIMSIVNIVAVPVWVVRIGSYLCLALRPVL